MDARTLQRITLLALVATSAVVLSSGCTPLRGTRLNPIVVPTGDGVAGTGIAGGTVVSAGGAPRPTESQSITPAGQIVQAQQPVAPMVPPDPLGLPRPLPPTPGAPTAPPPIPPAQNGQPPVAPPLPGAPVMVPPNKFGHAPQDPHILDKPTAAGGRMGLLPHEIPADRVVEFTIYLQNLTAQNNALAARIKELENAGLDRDKVLDEAARAIATNTAEAEKVRAALQARVTVLQSKVEQMEAEDIAILKAVIEALERLLPPPPREKKQ